MVVTPDPSQGKMRDMVKDVFNEGVFSCRKERPLNSGRMSGLISLEAWFVTYLVFVRKRSFSANAASICGLACAAYRCTPPRQPLISLHRRKIPRFQIENFAVAIRSFRMVTI